MGKRPTSSSDRPGLARFFRPGRAQDPIRQIAFATDFGAAGPYLAQMEARARATVPVTRLDCSHLVSDLVPFRPELAAYLLPRLLRDLAPSVVVCAVVDPGVGGDRRPLAIRVDGRWLVGPDNGLLAPLIAAAREVEVGTIAWRPTPLSASFHGRDLFAPVAARLACGEPVAIEPVALESLVGHEWGRDSHRIIYVDGYGNLMTGVDAASVADDAQVVLGGRRIGHARTFGSVAIGTPFWYCNAFGLVEVAVNGGSARDALAIAPGTEIELVSGGV